jgi:putative membrane protein
MKRSLPLNLSILFLALFIYQGILRPLLHPYVILPNLPGGLSLSTLLLMLFSFFHAWYLLGGRHALVFFTLSAVISWAFEQVGVATGLVFGRYHYTDTLGAKLGHVPLLIPIAWFMMIYPSYVIANLIAGEPPSGSRGGLGRIAWLAFLSAMVMTAWDLVVDPVLTGPPMTAWIWEQGGPYFGVPVHNFAGWMLTTFTIYLVYRLFERRIPIRSPERVSIWTVALPLVAYTAMLLANLLTGIQPALWVIGPFVMGLPVAAAASGLRRWALRRV